MKKSLKLSEIKDMFEYRAGLLIWKIKPRKNMKIGDIAGTQRTAKIDYLQVKIKGAYHKVHRIIYQLIHEIEQLDPNIVIDHIDGNPFNNLAENLREATLSNNQWNRKVNNDNRLKSKGICLVNRKSTARINEYYQLRIRKGETLVVKIFNTEKYTLQQVEDFRDSLLLELHGEFANNGQ